MTDAEPLETFTLITTDANEVPRAVLGSPDRVVLVNSRLIYLAIGLSIVLP